jgi:hypothetical protein
MSDGGAARLLGDIESVDRMLDSSGLLAEERFRGLIGEPFADQLLRTLTAEPPRSLRTGSDEATREIA